MAKPKKSISPKIVFLGIVVLVALILIGFYGYFKYKSFQSSNFAVKNIGLGLNSWYEYVPKCKALTNNLNIFIPNNWEASDDFPIYDGVDFPNLQAKRDFYNLVSQCQIVVGFGAKPDSYQNSHEGDRGVIYISAQNIQVSKDLKVKEWSFAKSDVYNNQTWSTVSDNGYEIDVSLEINHADYNSSGLNNYMNETAKDLVQRLIVK